MRKFITYSIVVVFLMTAVPANADIAVTPYTSATGLVNNILGSGITTSNITYTGATAASGFFTGGLDAGLQVPSGILLTSGYASNVDNFNNDDAVTRDNGLDGDADLNGLIPGFTTYDATILEFDFVSAGGDMFFNYAFGSDEYNEWTNTAFNDVFGFFLDGTNIALLPDGVTPVSINTVNGGDPLGTNASNPSLYNNNDLTDGGPFFAFEYDGFTDGFTASALGLAAGTHHIKLAIADAGDRILDSGVFIQAGTFSDEPTPVVPVPGAVLLGSIGMAFASYKLRKRKEL